jgi:hypothetical protein
MRAAVARLLENRAAHVAEARAAQTRQLGASAQSFDQRPALARLRRSTATFRQNILKAQKQIQEMGALL